MAEAKQPPDTILRARIVIQALEETMADLQGRPDAAKWSEQISTLETMRDDLRANLRDAENAA
ncbi:MAG: hypothetical protein ACJ74D_13130 [Gaiellaceae bacterium]